MIGIFIVIALVIFLSSGKFFEENPEYLDFFYFEDKEEPKKNKKKKNIENEEEVKTKIEENKKSISKQIKSNKKDEPDITYVKSDKSKEVTDEADSLLNEIFGDD